MKNKFAALALIVSFLTTSFVYAPVLPNSTEDYVRFLKEKLNFSLDKEKSTNEVAVYKNNISTAMIEMDKNGNVLRAALIVHDNQATSPDVAAWEGFTWVTLGDVAANDVNRQMADQLAIITKKYLSNKLSSPQLIYGHVIVQIVFEEGSAVITMKKK